MDKSKIVAVLQKVNKDLEIANTVNNDLIKVNNLIIAMLNGSNSAPAEIDKIMQK